MLKFVEKDNPKRTKTVTYIYTKLRDYAQRCNPKTQSCNLHFSFYATL